MSHENQDILDRPDVQESLFDANATELASAKGQMTRAQTVQLEIVSEGETVSFGSYLSKKLHSHVKWLGGLSYRAESEYSARVLQAKTVFLLIRDQFLLRPFVGLEVGTSLLDRDRYLLSLGWLGIDLQLTQHAGLSARSLWMLPNNTNLNAKYNWEALFEELQFALAFYWQI